MNTDILPNVLDALDLGIQRKEFFTDMLFGAKRVFLYIDFDAYEILNDFEDIAWKERCAPNFYPCLVEDDEEEEWN